MTTEIKHQWFYNQSPEEVWEYLTNAELLAKWLMDNDFKPVDGHEFQFRTKPMANFGFDGIIYCKVLEIVPQKKLSYTWKGGPGDGTTTLDTVVTWTLHKKDNGTELHLLHTGFKEQNAMIFSIMENGWLSNMKEIADFLNA